MNRNKSTDTPSDTNTSGKYKKNRLERYLNETKISAPEPKAGTEGSKYEIKRTYEKEAEIDIEVLNKIRPTDNDGKGKRLNRYELLERTLLNVPLSKLIKDTSSNSIRSIRDNPVYTKKAFLSKYGDDLKSKTMEDIESNFVYDPKSKLVKDETKGFYNNKNGKYYRYLNSEGKELKELEDTVRRDNILANIKQKQKLKKEGKRLSKEDFEKMNDKRTEVLFANPTLLAKQKRKMEKAADERNDQDVKKRDISQMSAKRTSSGKKLSTALLSKYK